MIARIHTKVRAVREMIHKLLVNIGRHHPQVGTLSAASQGCTFYKLAYVLSYLPH